MSATALVPKHWWDVSVTADEDELRSYAVFAEDQQQAKVIALEKVFDVIEADAVVMEGFDPELDGHHYDAVSVAQ